MTHPKNTMFWLYAAARKRQHPYDKTKPEKYVFNSREEAVTASEGRPAVIETVEPAWALGGPSHGYEIINASWSLISSRYPFNLRDKAGKVRKCLFFEDLPFVILYDDWKDYSINVPSQFRDIGGLQHALDTCNPFPNAK